MTTPTPPYDRPIREVLDALPDACAIVGDVEAFVASLEAGEQAQWWATQTALGQAQLQGFHEGLPPQPRLRRGGRRGVRR